MSTTPKPLCLIGGGMITRIQVLPSLYQMQRLGMIGDITICARHKSTLAPLIDDKDLKIVAARSGGKGGQNVNKVETAVHLTHIPSGIIVRCSVERSQHKNRVMALKLLKAKLFKVEEDKKRSEMERQYGEKGEVAGGSQIRSYVFQPYQMVKDHRTGFEMGNIQDVMDGNLDGFIEAKLRGQTPEK